LWNLVLIVIVLAGVLSAFLLFFSIPPKTENPQRAVMSIVKLPDPVLNGNMSVEQAILNRRSFREYSNKSLSLKDVSQLMWSAQGITDKQNNFRAAPSSGRTYPLEIYLVGGKSWS
jgi:hypothetical protein